MIKDLKLSTNTLRLMDRMELSDHDFLQLQTDLGTKYPAVRDGSTWQDPVTNLLYLKKRNGWQKIPVKSPHRW